MNFIMYMHNSMRVMQWDVMFGKHVKYIMNEHKQINK